MTWIWWAPLLAILLHIFEEFVWPGGFTAWYRLYRPQFEKSISRPFLFWINVALLFGCLAIGVDGPTPYGSALFLTMTAVLFTNGFFHLLATLRMRRYSPGVITGIALYVPLTVYGYAVILRHGLASNGTVIASAILGGSYHLFSAAFHRTRSAVSAG